MTVNYTTNLSLGQPVTGTESGNWGEDVNNALTAYLDIAISGTLSLTSASFTANALTLANTFGTYVATNIVGTTAQYYILKVSSLSANVTITVPSVSKTYLVTNTDTTYSVTIKAAGQSGTTLLAGEKALVGFIGTDYAKLLTTISGIPSGGIIMWSGSIATIPLGWYLCNGSNGTPDLRNTFIVGAFQDNAGVSNTTITGANTKTGGSKDAVVVSHTHIFTGTALPTHQHLYNDTGAYAGGAGPGDAVVQGQGDNRSTTAVSGGTPAGTNAVPAGSVVGTNANLVPYFALAYIMKA